MLNRNELSELTAYLRIEESGGHLNGHTPRKIELESKALRTQLTDAHYMAKYPALSEHMDKINHPFTKPGSANR